MIYYPFIPEGYANFPEIMILDCTSLALICCEKSIIVPLEGYLHTQQLRSAGGPWRIHTPGENLT